MMVDLYSLPHGFPGFEAGMKCATGGEHATALEESLAASLGDTRFIPYLQVHDNETLVLVEPTHLSQLYDVKRHDLDELTNQCAAYATPEDINHK